MSHPAAALSEAASGVGWMAQPAVVVPALLAAALYARGWALLSRRLPDRFGPGRAAAFGAGLAALGVALCSPLDGLGHATLRAHMTQHLLLMMVAPPLLWLGAPVAPLLLGLPRPLRRAAAALLAARPVRRLTAILADPRAAFVALSAALWVWHAPALYELALSSEAWHHAEHASFFLSALAFWRPVILPWPARPAWPRWVMIAYVLFAEAQATLLSAILTFADRVVYPSYGVALSDGVGPFAAAPLSAAGRAGLSPLDDQALAGVIMWVPGSAAFAIALLALVWQGLAPGASGRERADARRGAEPNARADGSRPAAAQSPAPAAAAAATAPTAISGSAATSAGQRS